MSPARGGRGSRFSYYQRLSAEQKRTYRKSDDVATVDLGDTGELLPLAKRVEEALAGGKRAEVERAANALCHAVLKRLRVPPLVVKVRSVRPSDHAGELHGLYTWEQGKAPLIEVWMRTAQHRKVVAFRTFLRTLLHEVCHHLDFTFLGLSDTFHTEGFFRRESSLVRQLAERARKAAPAAAAKPPRQLRLFQ